MPDESVRWGLRGWVGGSRRGAALLTRLALVIVTGTCCGCLMPVATRLDSIHSELVATRQELAEMNARLTETNHRLASIEALLKRFPLLKPASESPESESP